MKAAQQAVYDTQVATIRARAKGTPFRNGFNSFFTALQFGVTLGGGGCDSATCPFSITPMYSVQYEDEDGDQVCTTEHIVEGMDLQFSIYDISVSEGNAFTESTMLVGPSSQRAPQPVP